MSCVVIRTLEELLESERRQQEAKNAFRREIGYVDPEEVRRIGRSMDDEENDEDDDGDKPSASLSDLAADAADEARRREQGRGNESSG